MTSQHRRPLAPEALGPTITVGEVLVEIMATSIGFGFREPQSLIGPFPSGAPAIFVDQVARLGGGAGIVGSVGGDDFGKLNIERLQRDGVDVSALTTVTGKSTGTAFVRYRPDGMRDFVFGLAGSAAEDVKLTKEARALTERAGHLHVMGTALSMPGAREVISYAIDIVRARGGSISVDPNLRKELMQEGAQTQLFERLVDMADLLLPSGEELYAAAGVDEELDAVARLLSRGVGEIVLKRGASGSTYFGADGKRADAAAFNVTEVDPTGAGDCFGATYLTCRRMGMEPSKSLSYANAAGALTVTRQGPMEGAPDWATLDAFIAAQGEDRNE